MLMRSRVRPMASVHVSLRVSQKGLAGMSWLADVCWKTVPNVHCVNGCTDVLLSMSSVQLAKADIGVLGFAQILALQNTCYMCFGICACQQVCV